MSKVKIIGDKSVERILTQLPDKTQRSFWRKITRKASRPVIESARSKVPVNEGNLKRSIKYKDSKKYWGGFVAVDIKKNRGFENMKGKVLAFGAKSERKTKKGASRGNTKRPIRDFIQEAGEDSMLESVAIMEATAPGLLENEINKLK